MNKKMIMTALLLTSLVATSCANQQESGTTNATPTTAAVAAVVATSTTSPAGETATQAVTTTNAITTSDTTMSSPAQAATPAIVAAANAFLATLSDAEKETTLFDWSDSAQKQRWSNFPDGAFDRAGLMWGNMSEPQQSAWLAVMQATLSSEGYNRVLAAWHGDDALAGGGGGGANFGSAYYYIAIIGTPSEADPWQWQWGGHHITVNATLVGPNIALTPSFIGLEPIAYPDANGNTVRALGDIEDEAFALVNALDATQQGAAILGDTAINLVLGPGEDGKSIAAEGLPAAQMNADQQAAFLKLIGHYTGLVNDEAAAARMAEIQATLAETYFAWYGPTTQGNQAYFRITGPTLVIEYSPQGDRGSLATAGSVYHVHGIYRDPSNDYGAKYSQ